LGSADIVDRVLGRVVLVFHDVADHGELPVLLGDLVLEHEILQVEAHLHLLHLADGLEKLVCFLAPRFFRICSDQRDFLGLFDKPGVETVEFAFRFSDQSIWGWVQKTLRACKI
jgi:hypothetical protein